MIELRWVVPNRTTTEPPQLQYRHLTDQIGGTHGPWRFVPTVAVPDEEIPPPPVGSEPPERQVNMDLARWLAAGIPSFSAKPQPDEQHSK